MAVTTSGEDAGGTAELRSAAAAEALLLDVVHRHADELLRIARLHSLCADDAHDAYQRSLEQFLRHGRRLHRDTAHRWLFTVCRREALAVRRSRGELVGATEFDPDRLEARHELSPEDRAVAADAVARSAEALRALKPQERRALWLRADGHSYAEIQAATGWSYTKVNRCLTEGRRRFLARCAALEAGAECERWGGALAALAGGEATAAQLSGLRPHLRHCAGCRATLRSLHAGRDAVATVLPPGLVGAGAVEGHGLAERLEAAGRWLTRLLEAVAGPLQERAAATALGWQAAADAAAGAKLVAVAASTVALAGGAAVAAHDASPAAGPSQARAAARSAGTSASAAPVGSSTGARGVTAVMPAPPSVRAVAPSPDALRPGSVRPRRRAPAAGPTFVSAPVARPVPAVREFALEPALPASSPAAAAPRSTTASVAATTTSFEIEAATRAPARAPGRRASPAAAEFGP